MPISAVWRSGFGAIMFSVFQLLLTPAAKADRITMRAEVFGPLGLHLLTMRTNIEEMADRYAISVDYVTTGVAGRLVNEVSHAEARGRLYPGSAQPEFFRRDTSTNGAQRHNRVHYHPDGSVEASSTPPPHHPIELRADGSVDDVTAYFRLGLQIAATGSCALTVPVFDGRHLYDLVFSDAGLQVISLSGGRRQETVACRMARDDRAVPEAERNEGARQGTIWYAPLLPRGVWVPVRMQLETAIGTTVAHLAELEGPGVDLRL